MIIYWCFIIQEEDPDKHSAAALRVALTEVGLQDVANSLTGPS
jgi:hypothetical protein